MGKIADLMMTLDYGPSPENDDAVRAWLASHSEVLIAQRLGAAYTQGTLAIAEEFLRGRYLFSL